MSTSLGSLVAALCILGGGVQAHEFWIEPLDYTVASGETVEATFRNGEDFEGSTLSFIGGRSERFDFVAGGELQPVPARMGDNPALRLEDAPDGLLIVVHETADRGLTYRDWAKWVKFVQHKAFDGILQDHRARGLPEAGFRESYRRYAKTLIAVGDGAGADGPVGLFTEIVAGANPYSDDLSGGLPVQVLLDGAPKGGAQVEMFEKGPDGVGVTLHTADAEGRVVVPVRPGFAYLLDSVAIEPLEPEIEGDPVWKTHWAALTFAVPEA
ncbi:MAG: DUF4198 domain-containing protein [Pseudomonadota bacterium]